MAKRKTDAEKALNNNPGKRATQPKARPESGKPLTPQDLSAAGAAEWGRLSRALESTGKLIEADAGLLLNAATCYQRMAEAEAIITQQGLVVEGFQGIIVKNPACQLARDYATSYQKALTLLGINAAARPDLPPADLHTDPHGLLD
jgi:P27 family predicted phage terminase small subunit